MKTTVRIVTQERAVPVKRGSTHEIVEATGKLFRADGTATKKGSDLLRLILAKALSAQQHVDERARNIQEISVWIISGARGIPGIEER